MSKLFEDARKGALTGNGLKELAEIVANGLPEGSVAVAAVLMMQADPETYAIEFDDMIEYEGAVAGGGKSESIKSIIAKLMERIQGAMAQYADEEEEEEWSFDAETYRVLVYRIESNLDYYCIVAVTVDMQGDDAEVDESALLEEMAGYIKANAPAPAAAWCDEEEEKPRIFYRFGKLTDSGPLYDDDYSSDDDEYFGDDDEEGPEGEEEP